MKTSRMPLLTLNRARSPGFSRGNAAALQPLRRTRTDCRTPRRLKAGLHTRSTRFSGSRHTAFVRRVLALWVGVLAGLSGLGSAAEPTGKAATAGEAGEAFVFHTDWKGERIALPPAFAPAMKWKGIEEIRFAPGMFQARSDSFFSYAFVFSVTKDHELTQEAIQREILVYYRGLAESVSKSRGRAVEAGKFTFKLKRDKQAAGAPEQLPAATPVTQYSGELDWVEPFATGKPQVLHFEIQSWSDPSTARNYLFVCTSPKARQETAAIWTELRTIRRTFEVKNKPGN